MQLYFIDTYQIETKFKSNWKKKILIWYSLKGRILPWRDKKNQNFYCIWISEVMLQQTGVDIVIPYYKRFLKKWPNLDSFFKANLNEILKMWQGLGYYQRARNLFKAKEFLKREKISLNSESLKRLPGIGDYISCSISAILNDEACAVIDTNIRRVISRVFQLNVNDKDFKIYLKLIVSQLTPQKNNGAYCQSLMDLASLICKPTNPLCDACPIESFCLSKNFSKLKKRKVIIKKKKERVGVIFFLQNRKKFLVDISKDKLFEGLYCFPMSRFVDLEKKRSEFQIQKDLIFEWFKFNKIKGDYELVSKIDHEFSHFCLKLLIVRIRSKYKKVFKNYEWVNDEEFQGKPLSKLTLKVKEVVM